jgi:hypothetical protein
MTSPMRPLLLIALTTALTMSVAVAANGQTAFTVRSTLQGTRVLPHRIHWFAHPSLAGSKIAQVNFLIDGRLRWVEHNAPYDYGYNGNYLVTDWLTPGTHRFKVVAITLDGRRASNTVTARVLPASPPPAELAGTWTRTMTDAQTHGQPSGTWILKIDQVGWGIKVPGPGPGANLIDVAYLAPGLLESRGGIWTRPAPSDNPTQGNGWCDEPFHPVQYHWAVNGNTLTLTLNGNDRCGGESVIWAGDWTRKA